VARGGIEPSTHHFFANIFSNLSADRKKMDKE